MTSRTGRILIVEGEPIPGSKIQLLMQEKGFQCDLATDGPGALNFLALHHYDVVVTDLLIPKMNGGELVIRILSQLYPPTVVVHTSVREPEVFEGLKREGVDEIILKPTSLAKVAQRVDVLATVRGQSALNSCRKEIRKASSWFVPGQVVRLFVRCDDWIQGRSGRLETFRFGILFLGCILLGLGWGNPANEHWSNVCSMFGLCGLAFFFCLELSAYYREQCRAALSRSLTEGTHIDDQSLLQGIENWPGSCRVPDSREVLFKLASDADGDQC